MSDFFGKLKSGAGKVTFEADKMGRLNKAKGDLEKIKNQIQAQYLKLGELYYTHRTSMGVSGPAYDELCQAIVDLERQVVSKNEDIQRINAENYAAPGAPAPQPAFVQPAAYPPAPDPSQYVPPAPSAAAATTKFCSNCGHEMPVEVKFCPDCGTKV